MSNDHSAGVPSTDAPFCPACGQHAEAADRFCRSCGHRLGAGSAADEGPVVGAPAPRRHRRTALVAGALLGLAVTAAALALVLGGAFSSGQSDEAIAAQGRLAAERAERARVTAAFDDVMNRRDAFFSQERRYLNAMSDARDKIGRYRRDERAYTAENKRIEEEFADEWDECFRFAAIPCPDPDYPDAPEVPGFGKQTKQLRAAVEKLEDLRAGLASVQPDDELRVLHTQLLASVDSLKAEGAHNADVLDEAAQPAEGEGVGMLDKGKLRTLRAGGALPAIRQLNLAAIGVIEELKLHRLEYDVPGGRDLDSADHSDEA